MTTRIYFLSAVLIVSALGGQAQSPRPSGDNNPRFATKGYYAIGNNAERLSLGTTIRPDIVDGLPTPVSKGYYAIGDNKKKLNRHIIVLKNSGVPPRPTKGYYSIGADPAPEQDSIPPDR